MFRLLRRAWVERQLLWAVRYAENEAEAIRAAEANQKHYQQQARYLRIELIDLDNQRG
jgi:hypothetical protein